MGREAAEHERHSPLLHTPFVPSLQRSQTSMQVAPPRRLASKRLLQRRARCAPSPCARRRHRWGQLMAGRDKVHAHEGGHHAIEEERNVHPIVHPPSSVRISVSWKTVTNPIIAMVVKMT